MGVGFSDGAFYQDNTEALAGVHVPWTPKQLADQKEMRANETSGDFQSRFLAANVPLESTELTADALKSNWSTRIAEEGPKQEKPIDAWNTLTGSNGVDRYQLWPERMVRAAWEGLKAPGEAAQGKLPMWAVDAEGNVSTSTQAIEKANDLASLMVTGPAPVAARLADGTLGSFAGVTSKTINKDKLYKAQTMEMDLAHRDEIWAQTGFFKGADGRWRYEIPDANSKIRETGLNVERGTVDNPTGWNAVGNHGDKFEIYSVPESKKNFFGESKPKLLKDILDHPELYEAYPTLANVKVFPMPEGRNSVAFARPVSNEIFMSAMPLGKFKDVLHHEIQHIIQAKEGFAQGGNHRMFRPAGLDEAEKQFEKAKADFKAKNGEDYLSYRGIVEADLNGTLKKILEKDPELGKVISERLKEAKDKGVYGPLSNIVKSEKLLAQQYDKEYAQYMALMGEVEARNVATRAVMDFHQRKYTPPYVTEDTARSSQINTNASGMPILN